ncbi:MAG: translation elongation factor Ts [Arenicellales bacterium]|nr:translation elongation factor Ts [Arenicellales bacterium]MDP6672280.1 translation elongation factor Ts [Arenicellales bacterium]MDP6723826.1 translation elongation factor Ts [Arenicellales bacterium]
MTISASMVKDLRVRTGAGMMECKRALTEVEGDIDAAIELLRKKGAASADKKAGRIAAEGVVFATFSDDRKAATLVEVNCETDFVAKDEGFVSFVSQVALSVQRDNPADTQALSSLSLGDKGQTVEEARKALIGKIGENISIRRFIFWQAEEGSQLSGYLHGSRIGVLVEHTGSNQNLGRDIAMHVAASQPLCVSTDEIPRDVIDKERKIYKAQAMESGKPEAIMEKMVEGRVNKFKKENTLLGQPFVKDPDLSVEKVLSAEGESILRFIRYEVGEGIEKREDDFVSEVMAQAKGG